MFSVLFKNLYSFIVLIVFLDFFKIFIIFWSSLSILFSSHLFLLSCLFVLGNSEYFNSLFTINLFSLIFFCSYFFFLIFLLIPVFAPKVHTGLLLPLDMEIVIAAEVNRRSGLFSVKLSVCIPKIRFICDPRQLEGTYSIKV